jgi:serine/threonine protein kinase
MVQIECNPLKLTLLFLQPENILLAKDTRYPRIVITDFGLAVDLQIDWLAHGNFGTPG